MRLCSISFARSSLLLSFQYPSTSEIYTLSLHDALPIFRERCGRGSAISVDALLPQLLNDPGKPTVVLLDRKSTRLNSSHANISYAVFCLKKKKSDTDAATPSPRDTVLHLPDTSPTIPTH